jgi:predicted ribonuclease YlaK
MPLLHAEILVQITYMTELLEQLKHYLRMLAFPSDHWTVVLDTNVFIHGKMFHEIDWHKEIDVGRVTVVMPLVVLDELDRIKDRDSQYGGRAFSVLRALDRLTGAKAWLSPIHLRSKVWIQLLNEPPGHQRLPIPDDEIVRQARYFAQLNENRLVLVTRDRGMRLRAQASGLMSQTLPERLERVRAPADD